MKMRSAGRLSRRLFYCLISLAVCVLPRAVAQGPGTTSIHDVVYRADGTPTRISGEWLAR